MNRLTPSLDIDSDLRSELEDYLTEVVNAEKTPSQEEIEEACRNIVSSHLTNGGSVLELMVCGENFFQSFSVRSSQDAGERDSSPPPSPMEEAFRRETEMEEETSPTLPRLF